MIKKIFSAFVAALSLATTIHAQVSLNGPTSGQNFDSLAASGTTNVWSDNSTLQGWYVQSVNGFGGDYRASAGTSTAGDLYSFGSDADRALGTLVSSGTGPFAFGVRLRNDTDSVIGNFQLDYTGEQWRNSGQPVQSLQFSYQTSLTPIINADPSGTQSWINLPEFNFNSPITGGTVGGLNGNAAAQQVQFSSTLGNIKINPGEELFLRWTDIDDAGSDHGLGIDNLSLSYSPVPEPSTVSLLLLAGAGLLGCVYTSRVRATPNFSN